jgi:ABC-type polar amino acid transport system ATPase subunit
VTTTRVALRDLHKSFDGLNVLNGIDLEINEGEVVVVIGPSGSGKSTMLRCINRLEECTRGRIEIDGVDITSKKVNIDKIRQRVGMVFQQFNLFPHMSVLDNVTIALRKVKKVPKGDSSRRPTPGPRSFPAVSSSAWRSRARWP